MYLRGKKKRFTNFCKALLLIVSIIFILSSDSGNLVRLDW